MPVGAIGSFEKEEKSFRRYIMILNTAFHLIQMHSLMAFKKLTDKPELHQIYLVPLVLLFGPNNLSVVLIPISLLFSWYSDTAKAVKEPSPGNFPVH